MQKDRNVYLNFSLNAKNERINCSYVIITKTSRQQLMELRIRICFRLILRATVKIEKGSEIYTTYTHTLNPTLLRRDHIQQSKFFDCKCSRCSDPTELGTNMSSMKCNKCDSGFIMSSDPLSEYVSSATRRQSCCAKYKVPKRC